MKILGVLVIGFALAACAPQQTLEQLENQAMLTGDWSHVEARERKMRRKAARDAEANLVCPPDMTSVCQNSYGDRRCSCVDQNVMRDIFANF